MKEWSVRKSAFCHILQSLNGQTDDAWRQQHQAQQAQQQQGQHQAQQQAQMQLTPSMHAAVAGLKKDREEGAAGSSGLDEADITVCLLLKASQLL